MTWLDERNEFCDATAISISETADAILGDVIDLGPHRYARAHSRATINVVNSANTFTRTTGSFLDDGWAAGATVKFAGFTNAANNVETAIVTVTDTVMTVTAATYTDESGDGNETATSVGSPGGGGVRDLGAGEPMYLIIQVTTAVASLTSLRLRLYSDITADLATSPKTHWDSGVLALAGNWDSTGTKFSLAIPVSATYERYLGLWQNVVGTATAGAVNAFLTQQPEAYTAAAGPIH